MTNFSNIKKLERHFLPKNFTITTWQSIEPYCKQLMEADISTETNLHNWLLKVSELEAVVSEDACWKQIKMTCDTENKALEEVFNYFCIEIQPHIQVFADAINKKMLKSPAIATLQGDAYCTYLRKIKKSIELFKEQNVPIHAELNVLQQQFGTISGKMSVAVDGKEYTLQQASKFLLNPNRSIRQNVYFKIMDRRLQDKEALHQLYTTLIAKRHQIAINAGFDNYADYKFEELGRFDYTKNDCFQFHQAVKEHIIPLVNEIYTHKKNALQVDTLKPWDTEAEPNGIKPLKPFETGKELLEKTIQCFEKLEPEFANCLKQMNTMGHFDLESRKGKAPGGYNCPLTESGAPFIFMNAAGQMDDVTTMVHEGGHAIHSFLAHPLALSAFKEYPMEIAEVASMAMELFSMDYWDTFFDNEADLKRAKIHQLERVITIFPWIAIIDKFQHWVYQNPNHTIEQRNENWLQIINEFAIETIDYTGLEAYRATGWQKQLHLFEVPFYYIEYGIAQLGAIGLWKQFKQNKQQAINNYIAALKLGGTKTLPQLYAAAGLEFNVSPAYIKDLIAFVHTEMKALM
jgi:oligoendopeptidase F